MLYLLAASSGDSLTYHVYSTFTTRFIHYTAIINIQFTKQDASRLYYIYSTAGVKTVWERRSNQEKQENKCAYIVTFRGVRATIFAGKKINKYYIFWVCVYNLRYPARNALTPYCFQWPVWPYIILPHYLINRTTYGKIKLLYIKCVFWFSLRLPSEVFLIPRRI